jgi:hypothetical protein
MVGNEDMVGRIMTSSSSTSTRMHRFPSPRLSRQFFKTSAEFGRIGAGSTPGLLSRSRLDGSCALHYSRLAEEATSVTCSSASFIIFIDIVSALTILLLSSLPLAHARLRTPATIATLTLVRDLRSDALLR